MDNVFYWVARENSSFGWHDSSAGTFATEKEAYDDMMRAAIEKMKWGHDYVEDFGHEGDDAGGCYEVDLDISVNQITLTQHTGRYVFNLVKVDREKLTTIAAISQLLASTTENGKFVFDNEVTISLEYCNSKIDHTLVSIYLNPQAVGQVCISTEICRKDNPNDDGRFETLYDALMDFSTEEVKLIFDEFIIQHLINKI